MTDYKTRNFKEENQKQVIGAVQRDYDLKREKLAREKAQISGNLILMTDSNAKFRREIARLRGELDIWRYAALIALAAAFATITLCLLGVI